MREKWARQIALLTGLMVVLLVMAFTLNQNPRKTDSTAVTGEEPEPELQKPAVVDLERIEAGHLVYENQGCALCHSLLGKGNPRYPLDGVGSRLTSYELRDRIVGADTLKGTIPERALKFKQSYKELNDEDLNNLIIYLQSSL